MPEVNLQTLIHQLAESRALDLRGYKHSTLERRVRKRMAQVGIETFGEYVDKFQRDAHEMDELLNTVLINVTEFFRDPQAWEVLYTDVLPLLLQPLKPGDSFRAWCAGCSSGEEPYSLAILLSERFGGTLSDYDVKIYGTDVDENALGVARRGEYSLESLRRVRPEWLEKYFQDGSMLRINRELRRNVIFGRSNLLADAPISHCHLVICRNVLIYFDAEAQQQILSRLHYALEPSGVLWLGKAESKLNESVLFKSLNSRWRMFQRLASFSRAKNREKLVDSTLSRDISTAEQELRRLQLQQRLILETVRSGILVLNETDVIVQANDAALAIWGLSRSQFAGRPILETELASRCPELMEKLLASRGSSENITFRCHFSNAAEERTLSITLKPMLMKSSERVGTLVYCENVTDRAKLQTTVEQLESTSEELQSSNEELETTNEELQSTNEELETTNEELQSTNEELETTNEELQSLNEELENMNEELESRTRELHSLTHRYADTLQSMPWPIMLLDQNDKIQLWNKAAQKLFGIGSTSVVGVSLSQLPLDDELRKTLLRRCKAVLKTRKAATLRDQAIHSGRPGINSIFNSRL